MQGTRVHPNEKGHLFLPPASYGKDSDGVWNIRAPKGGGGILDGHTVVEHDDGTISHGVPSYFQLEYDNDWTRDANEALRFARRQDAQAYINHVGWTEPKAVEHMWLRGREA